MAEISQSLERPEDLGKTPKAVARRWKLKLRLADKRESAWRKKAAEIYKLYTPENPAAASFNILWTNTETLRQSVYNSLPQPDVRRRYQDEDPLGKAVGEVLTRALEFCQDAYDFDGLLQADVLSMLLPGRAVSRVRYVPDIAHMGSEDAEKVGDDLQESEAYEEIQWEQAICERVMWDDFRILCAAKTWDKVSAIGFRHRMTREDLCEAYGDDIGNRISLVSVDDDDVNRSRDADLFKTADVWEIWDKEEKQVVWITESYPEPLKTQEDPLSLSGFFPTPRPLYAIENDQTLVPAALFAQYEQQAKELNLVSRRINRLVDGLKVRGIYDSTVAEISNLSKAGDYELVPAQNVTALLERGGLEKAIWMMPIDTAAMVLKELYVQRDATKQVIYEITGISDIMRAASDPNETFGAQKIKAQWGTQRLQRLQREVQRYIRDLVRLKAEVIAEKFQLETLERMTLIELPHQAEIDAKKQQMMAQYQQAVMQAQMQGQPAPPPPQFPPDPITWEAVVQAMRDNATRTYKVDIETDSTLSATQDSDMDGLQKLLAGMSQLIQGFGPAVQAGAVPIEAVKALMGVVVRRAKMGTAVEDALEKMKVPSPPADPNASKISAERQAQQAQLQHEAQLEQLKGQQLAQLEQFKAQLLDAQHQRQLAADAQAEQQKAQLTAQLQAHEQQVQAQQNEHQNQLESRRELQRQQLEAARAQQDQQYKLQMEQARLEFDRWKAELDNATKVTIAQISAQSSADQSLAKAQTAANTTVYEELPDKPDPVAQLADMHIATLDALGKLAETIARPKTVRRGPDGKIVGVE